MSILRARRHLHTQAVCREPPEDRCRKRTEGKRVGDVPPKGGLAWGPSHQNLMHVQAMFEQEVQILRPALLAGEGSAARGKQWWKARARPRHLGAGAQQVGVKRKCDGAWGWSQFVTWFHLFLFLMVHLAKLGTGGKKSILEVALFWKEFRIQVVRQKQVWGGFS